MERRHEGPHRWAYPDYDGYLRGFYLWRALRRDERLNDEEAQAYNAVVMERIAEP